MDRRTFNKCITASSVAVVLFKGGTNSLFAQGALQNMSDDQLKSDIKKAFTKYGCSRSSLYMFNQEFGYSNDTSERATDLFVGGLLREGYQCGLLWGATLGVGAESLRRYTKTDQAIGVAVTATQNILQTFSNSVKDINCQSITKCNLSGTGGMAKYLLSGRFIFCNKLAQVWVPEAIKTAFQGTVIEKTGMPSPCISCASEVAKKMGANDEEMVMVAGFAGGIGLSGHTCGALGAALWLNSIRYCKENPEKTGYANKKNKDIISAFRQATMSEFKCNKISGMSFKSIYEHTEFVKNGGCSTLINMLSMI